MSIRLQVDKTQGIGQHLIEQPILEWRLDPFVPVVNDQDGALTLC